METSIFKEELLAEIQSQGAGFVRFVDISHLSVQQNKEFPTAILIGIALTKAYLRKVAAAPDYVEQMKSKGTIGQDEFHLTELKTDRIADRIQQFLELKGYKAYAQSEDNIQKTGYYDHENRTTPLPHKTIAGLAGLGWIGKHNLLVTKEYGSAVSMCSVLTNAPLPSTRQEPLLPRCGDCNICTRICGVNALKGKNWECGIAREKIVDVFLCTTCFQCVVQCPWTKKYYKSE